MDDSPGSQITIIIVVLTACWGGMFNIMKIVEMKNRIRNQVLDISGKSLTKAQKTLLLEKDYLPMAYGIWFFLIVFAVGLAAVPLTLNAKGTHPVYSFEWIVSFGASAFALFAMGVDVWATRAESKIMRRNIDATDTSDVSI